MGRRSFSSYDVGTNSCGEQVETSVSLEDAPIWDKLIKYLSIRQEQLNHCLPSKKTPTTRESAFGDGEPCRLKFITFDHPSGTRNVVNRNIIRSHVMINVRRQQKKQKLQGEAKISIRDQISSGNSSSDPLESPELLELPFLCQPSQTVILQQYLVSHFLSLNPRGKSTIGSFFALMPQFLSDSAFRPLKQATMAVVTNHYGATVRDESIQLQSRAPYITALNGLLKLFLQARSNRVIGAELGISISILLMIYELRTGETTD
jgi:hypothetical protein